MLVFLFNALNNIVFGMSAPNNSAYLVFLVVRENSRIFLKHWAHFITLVGDICYGRYTGNADAMMNSMQHINN